MTNKFITAFLLVATLLLSHARADSPPAAAMVRLPDGVFLRGDGTKVKLTSFAIANTEMTRQQWDSVRNWAVKHGYEFETGNAEGPKFPIFAITWYDAVKFCNAASERAGRRPVYYQHGKVYRHGTSDKVTVDGSANGYRLPTEAEWEYACRAGTTTKYYWGNRKLPWNHNPYAWSTNFQARGNAVNPHPVALKKPNAFKLFDMSGNVFEWCWDWYGTSYQSSAKDDPHGPASGCWRVIRGGSVALDSIIASGYRSCVAPGFRMYDLGFRVASSDPTCPVIASDPGAKHVAMKRRMTMRDDKAVAEKLIALIDLGKPGLTPTRAAYLAGHYGKALDAFRDYFFKSQRAIALQSEYREDGFGRAPKADELKDLMAVKGRIPWYTPLKPGGLFYIRRPGGSELLKQWQMTGNCAPLHQWFYITSQFATFAVPDFLMLHNADRMNKNNYNAPLTWDWGMGFDGYTRLLRQLRKIVHALPPNGADRIPATQLAEIVTFVATTAVDLPIKDPRDSIPNQSYSAAMAILDMGDKLRAFRDEGAWTALGRYHFVNDASRTVLPDGGDLEQSLNYNGGMPRQSHSLIQMYGQHVPAWTQLLQNTAIKRLRMLASLTTPFGGPPTTGTAYTCYPTDIYKSSKRLHVLKLRQYRGVRKSLNQMPDSVRQSIYDSLFDHGKQSPPAFTSIAFPYSGYYVMRDGWSPFSHYLWLMGARPGEGHACENINGIEVAAFGRYFLVAAGASSYGNPKFVPKDQLGIISQIDQYRDRSSSRNTVVVDGQTQQRVASGRFTTTTPYQKPIRDRWHSSRYFDLAEGDYDDGYGDRDGVTIHADHHRQVIFLRKQGLWLVTDRLTASWPHTYSATWGFLPVFKTRLGPASGFKNNQIKVNAKQHTIFTEDPDGPNVFLYQASTAPITYQRFYGRLNPARGWMAPGIGGRRYPKTDIWSSWKGLAGSSQLVTAICPAKHEQSPVTNESDLSHGSITGIHLRLQNGTRSDWRSTPQPATLKAGPVSITGNALLLVVDTQGQGHGIILGCRKLKVDKHPQKASMSDFEYTLANGKLTNLDPIQVPKTFSWHKAPAGFVPVYQDKDLANSTRGEAATRVTWIKADRSCRE